MSVASKLAVFFVATSPKDLPATVVEHAKIAVANTIASAAAGSDKVSAAIVRKLVKERGGPGEATIWFDPGPKVYVSDAARANAMMSDAAASDDSHMKCYAHPGTIAVSTAIAVGERVGASGKDVLCAITLGYEAAGRIGERISPVFLKRGIHNCIISVFGGAVATGKLLGLTSEQMTQAIALAATSMGGLRIATNSHAREYHAGISAMQGINAALAALNGYTIDEHILEARSGFFETYGSNVDIEAITRSLGEDWDIVTDMALKLIPGVHGMHALVEAAILAAKAGNVMPKEVERITVAGSPFLKTVYAHLHPQDFPGMIHSLSFYMALCVAEKEFAWDSISLRKLNDPVLRSLQEKVRLELVPGRTAADYPRGGTVTITTKDGRSYSHTVDWPRGSPQRGIEWSDVDAKYRALVPRSELPQDRIEQGLRLIHRFDNVANVSELTALLSA
ncbi:MAG: MmgE/PrpD family protein [Chloroflexi bacterium]|nr:MmgE/PrpD family protein [Chloroflexota bacterium]